MKKYNVKILSFYLLLFYFFVLIILLVSGFSYSKYKSEQRQLIFGSVAKPIFIIQKDDTKIINTNSNLENYEYNFSIMNYDNNICSDVAIAYQIVVDIDNSNLIYKLFDEKGNEIAFSNNKSPIFVLDNHINTKQSYRMVISKSINEIKAGEIKINVEGNQIING